MMIGRVWHGWTTHANADAFESICATKSGQPFFARNIMGLREMQCMRLTRPGHTEFRR
jgi:hypothetical protein